MKMMDDVVLQHQEAAYMAVHNDERAFTAADIERTKKIVRNLSANKCRLFLDLYKQAERYCSELIEMNAFICWQFIASHMFVCIEVARLDGEPSEYSDMGLLSLLYYISKFYPEYQEKTGSPLPLFVPSYALDVLDSYEAIVNEAA